MNERSIFRDRLLAVEPIQSEYQEKFKKEITAMLEKQLSSPQRWIWGISTALGISFFFIFSYVAITIPTHENLAAVLRIIFSVGALFGLIWAILAGKILFKGVMNLKTDAAKLTGLIWIFIVFMITAFMLLAGRNPDSIRGVGMVVNGMVFFIMAAVFMLQNHINQAQLKTQEKLLELEYRLAEISEILKKR